MLKILPRYTVDKIRSMILYHSAEKAKKRKNRKTRITNSDKS